MLSPTEKNKKLLAIVSVVRGIRQGDTLSYGAIAVKAGYPTSARYVGHLMSLNYDPTIPCHRVVTSDGRIGKYNRGEQEKVRLLLSEGVRIKCVRGVEFIVQSKNHGK